MATDKGNRSGNPDIDRSDAYYTQRWEEITDKAFDQTIFHAYAALVRKGLVHGHRSWQPYEGGEYDREKYDLVEGMWDHEHCSICNVRIADGNTYWFNQGRIRLLCDECYDNFSNP